MKYFVCLENRSLGKDSSFVMLCVAGWLAAQWSGEEKSYSHTSSNDFLVEINWMKFVFFEREEKTCIVGMATRRRKYFYHFCKKNGKVLNENGILPTWTGRGGVHAREQQLWWSNNYQHSPYCCSCFGDPIMKRFIGATHTLCNSLSFPQLFHFNRIEIKLEIISKIKYLFSGNTMAITTYVY